MSTQFLTIKEAADRYEKAEITIRRFVRNIVKESQHKDRSQIRPSPSESEKLKKSRKPFSYSISAQLLNKIYGAKVAEEEKIAPTEEHDHMYLEILKDQLKVKDEQIRALNQALDDVSERQRETNILMKGLQEQLLLKSGKKKKWWFW